MGLTLTLTRLRHTPLFNPHLHVGCVLSSSVWLTSVPWKRQSFSYITSTLAGKPFHEKLGFSEGFRVRKILQ